MVHVIIINLKKRTDRWEKLTDHLKLYKDRLTFVDSFHRLEAVMEPTSPAKGCMLSHRNAIQLAKGQFWDSVLVVEDDVRFRNDVPEIWNSVMEELKDNATWNIIFGASVRVRPKDLNKYSPHLLGLRSPNGILTGTHCVLYHSRCYDAVIDMIDKEIQSDYPYHLDLLLSSKLKGIFLSVPYLALFAENDTSDVRVGKDTTVDYQNLMDAHKMASMLIASYK